MKFGKKLSAQMVQEWQGAYMDYTHLKHILKRTSTNRTSNNANPPTENDNQGTAESPFKQPDKCFQTMFLRVPGEGGELEGDFFERIDHEFNKVASFYAQKVEEVRSQAEKMGEQMDLLLARRTKVEKPCVGSESQDKDVIEEIEQSASGDEHISTAERDGDDNDIRDFKPASGEILDHVKINVDPDTPRSTPSVKELRKNESKLRQAMVEFYQQLQLLKNYGTLLFSRF